MWIAHYFCGNIEETSGGAVINIEKIVFLLLVTLDFSAALEDIWGYLPH